MRNVLTQYGIPTDTLPKAITAVNAMDAGNVSKLCAEFGLSPEGDTAYACARYAAEAIVKLGDAATVDKVVGHVRRKVAGMVSTVVAPVVVVGVPVVDNPEVIIEPVTVLPTEEVVADKVVTVQPAYCGRGRRPNANSGYHRTVAYMQANPGKDRAEVIAELVASGMSKKSVYVYLWKYANA